MGVYDRGSRFWWMHLEGTNRKLSTKIPVGKGAARRDSRIQAEEVYRAAMGDLVRGTLEIRSTRRQITFSAYVEWYRANVTQHHRGHRRELSTLKALVAYFGDRFLHEITAADLETWKTVRSQTHHRHTVNRELDVLKALLRRAVPQYLKANPADAVKRFPARPVPITILSPSAERALLEHATPAETAMVLLGLDALLRLGDVRRLHMDHDKGIYLEVVDPKTEPYKVPVSRRLRAALDALDPAATGGFYFGRRYKQQWAGMGEGTAFEMFAALCDRAGVTRGRKAGGITFHALRHTGATRAASNVKLTVVQRLGGWKSLKQLVRYDHPDDPEMIRAVEAIGARAR